MEFTKEISIVVKPSRRTQVKKAKVLIEGDLTILNVEVLRNEISKVLQDFDLIDIELNQISNLDITCCQLFSILKSKSWEDKTIKIKANFEKSMSQLLKATGNTHLFFDK